MKRFSILNIQKCYTQSILIISLRNGKNRNFCHCRDQELEMFRFVQNAMQRQFFFCPFFFIVIITCLVNRTTYFSQHRKTISKSFLFSILVILAELIQILIPLRHGVCGISRRTSFKVQRLCAKRLSCLTHHCLKPSMCLPLKSTISSNTPLQTITHQVTRIYQIYLMNNDSFQESPKEDFLALILNFYK